MTMSYIKLSIAAMLPVLLSIAFYELRQHNPNWDEHSVKGQIIIGISFGIVAIIGTEWGIQMDGYKVNCRDAAPLCAGLLFGGPAGIIAGVIGGVERWFAVYWGGGTFTRVACSVATVVAGVAAGAIRKFMLDDRRPGWLLALFLGIAIEVFHLTLVFLTNMDQATEAMNVAKACTLPMLTANGLAVLLATSALSWLSGKRITKHSREHVHIVDLIQQWLLVCVMVAFVITMLFTYSLQTDMAKRNAKHLLTLSISDMADEINDTADDNMLELAYSFKTRYNKNGDFETAANVVEASEVNLIDENGVVVASNVEENVGYDMASNEETAQYLKLLGDDPEVTEIVEDFRDNAVNGEECKYVGISYKGGAIQIGFSMKDFVGNIANQVTNAANNRHVGQTGALIIANKNGAIVSMPEDYEDLVKNYIKHYDSGNAEMYRMYEITAGDQDYYIMYTTQVGYYIIGILPKTEAMEHRDITAFLMGYTEILISALLFVMIYMLVKLVVVSGIYKTNRTLTKITEGDLNARVEVRNTKEFTQLSFGINATVEALKRYIAEANARIDRELHMAKDIQKAALPSSPPADAGRRLFATNIPAKEVGGDFYDFYFVDGNHLVLLMADVSGKGIPAALFMMRAKTQLKGLTENGHTMDEVFALGNNALCEGNDAEMFVTAWEGLVDLNTGILNYANAGHNPPLVKRAGGKFEYIKSRKNMVLAAMPDMPYQVNTIQLSPGDQIFLYTDGVTEATSSQKELYGEFRLRDALNSKEFTNMEELCQFIKADVDRFVGDAPQFDDITMMAFHYCGPDPQVFMEENK